MFIASPYWPSNTVFVAVVTLYVLVVLVTRVLQTSSQAQNAFRAGLEIRESSLIDTELKDLLDKAGALVPKSPDGELKFVPTRQILQAWQILHHIDAERGQGAPADVRFALASELDRQKGKNSELNKMLVTSLAGPKAPPIDPAELLPAGRLARRVSVVSKRRPTDGDRASTNALSEAEVEKSAALRAARRLNDSRRDRIAAQQADLARRGLFLLVLGGVAVIIAGLMLGHHLLLAVGAGAGILSRMSSRSNEVKRSGTDYGVAWTKLILSPLVGALGALFGVILIGGFGNAGVFGPSICPLITPVIVDLAPNPVSPTNSVTTTTTMKRATNGTVAQTPANTPTTNQTTETENSSATPEQSPQEPPQQSPPLATPGSEVLRGLVSASILPPPLPTDTDSSPQEQVSPTSSSSEAPPTIEATTTPTTASAPSIIVAPAQPCPTDATNPDSPTTPPVKQDRESTTTVALAIVLGFAERLFARMIGRSENYITGELDGTNKKGDTE